MSLCFKRPERRQVSVPTVSKLCWDSPAELRYEGWTEVVTVDLEVGGEVENRYFGGYEVLTRASYAIWKKGAVYAATADTYVDTYRGAQPLLLYVPLEEVLDYARKRGLASQLPKKLRSI
jgi:hypothetical protein